MSWKLDQVHCSHAAQGMGVTHEFAARSVEADSTAVSSHPAALGFTRTWSFPFLARAVIVVDAVVVLTQHRQIRWLSVPAVLMSIDMVHLAPIGRHVAVRPRTHEILCHGERP